MTEPDEALLWARDDVARNWAEIDAPYSDDVRHGCYDDDRDIWGRAHAYRAGAAASADREEELKARVAELEAALVKANEPHWYYSDEEGSPWRSLEEALEQVTDDIRDLYHAEDMPSNHVVEIETSRPCPTIWGVVRFLTDDEVKARGDDEPWVFTPCATEAEARALLKEPEQ